MANCPSCKENISDKIYVTGNEICPACHKSIKENPKHKLIWLVIMFLAGFISMEISKSIVWSTIVLLGLVPFYFLTKTFLVDDNEKAS